MSSDSQLTTVELGDIGEFKNGANFSQNDYGPGYPIINVKQLFGGRYIERHGLESLRKAVLKRPEQLFLKYGDILFARSSVKRSGAGQCAMVPEGTNETIFSGFIIRFRLNDLSKNNPSFLSYLLQSPEYREIFPRIATGTTISNLSQDALRRVPVRLPSKRTQDEAVSVLGALDDRITLLRETNATLEAIAQALFKSWFVDFDPVRAKQEGRAPEGMDEATAAQFPDGFEESELGLVPRGWWVGLLGDIAQTARQQVQVSDLHADMHYVGLEHIPRKSLSLTAWSNADGLESAKAAFSEGDILFGKLRPYFHKVVIAPFAGVCSTDILVCQPRTPDYFGVAAMHLFSDSLIDYADRLSNGAKMPRVNWKDLAAYPVCIPPAEIAAKLNGGIRPLVARMMANTYQAQTLATLHDTLLPRLISGQLRLPEAEAVPAG